jgi:hypothetical protein
LAFVVDFEPKNPKPQAAQKAKIFFQNDPFPLPIFLQIDPENANPFHKLELQNFTNYKIVPIFYGLVG